MTTQQVVLFETIEAAVTAARVALEGADPADCIDWLTTVQSGAVELVTSLMTRIQTKPF